MSAYNEWATPLEVFTPLDAEFGFTVDVAAAEWNHKLERFYTLESNGLSHSWSGERVWCNPPFDNPIPWIQKARLADLAVLLLPLWGRQPFLGLALEWSTEFRRLGRVAYDGKYGCRGARPAWESGLFIFRAKETAPAD